MKSKSSDVTRYLGTVTALTTLFIHPVFAEAQVNTADGLPSIEIFVENLDGLRAVSENPSLDGLIKKEQVKPFAPMPVIAKKTVEQKTSLIAEKPAKKNKKIAVAKTTPKALKIPPQDKEVTTQKAAVTSPAVAKQEPVKTAPAIVAAPIPLPKPAKEEKVIMLKEATKPASPPVSTPHRATLKATDSVAAKMPVQPVVKKEIPEISAKHDVIEKKAPVEIPPVEKANVAPADKEEKATKSFSFMDWLPFGKDKKSSNGEKPSAKKEVYFADTAKENSDVVPAIDKKVEKMVTTPEKPMDTALPPSLPELPELLLEAAPKVASPVMPAPKTSEKPAAVVEKALPEIPLPPLPLLTPAEQKPVPNEQTGKEVVLTQPPVVLPLPMPVSTDKKVSAPVVTTIKVPEKPVAVVEKALAEIPLPLLAKPIENKSPSVEKVAETAQPYQLASLPKPDASTSASKNVDSAASRMQLLSLNFSKNQVNITDSEKKLLNSQLKPLVSTSKRLTIVSYASSNPDQAGSDRRVSLQRAIEVRKIIMELGIDDIRINVQAMGDSSPNNAKDHLDVFSITEFSTLQ